MIEVSGAGTHGSSPRFWSRLGPPGSEHRTLYHWHAILHVLDALELVGTRRVGIESLRSRSPRATIANATTLHTYTFEHPLTSTPSKFLHIPFSQFTPTRQAPNTHPTRSPSLELELPQPLPGLAVLATASALTPPPLGTPTCAPQRPRLPISRCSGLIPRCS